VNTKFAKQSNVENLPKVGETHALSKPVTLNSVPTPQESKVMKNDKTTQRPEGHSLEAIQRMIGSPLRLRVVESRFVDMDQDEGIELVIDQEKDAEVEGRHADKQAEIYNIDLDHSSKVFSMQEDDTEVQEVVEVVTTAKLMTKVVTAVATQVAAASTPISAAKPKTLTITAAPAVSTRRRKGVEIRDPKEELHTDTPAETLTV
nr:hypothetical protein [Tanacetum cinerariifolium]